MASVFECVEVVGRLLSTLEGTALEQAAEVQSRALSARLKKVKILTGKLLSINISLMTKMITPFFCWHPAKNWKNIKNEKFAGVQLKDPYWRPVYA